MHMQINIYIYIYTYVYVCIYIYIYIYKICILNQGPALWNPANRAAGGKLVWSVARDSDLVL